MNIKLLRRGFAAAFPVLFSFLTVANANTQSAPASAPQPAAPVLAATIAVDLNTKTAKVGDVITAKTVKHLKLKDMEIPYGARIVGKVVAVQSMQNGNGTSSLAIAFEQVDLKHNQVLPIRGQIVAIGPATTGTDMDAESIFGRNGVGSTPGTDPSVANARSDNSDIPNGSTLPGVALANALDAGGATEMRGIKKDIKLDRNVMIKVALFRPASASEPHS